MKIVSFVAGLVTATVVFVGAFGLSKTVFAPDMLEKQAYPVDTNIKPQAIVAVASGTPAAAASAAPAFLTGDSFEKLVDAGDSAKGAATAKKCAMCHDLSSAATNKIGPALWAVVDRKIAGHAGYSYSAALKAVDKTWNIDSLNQWLFNPKAFAAGNKMAFAGIKNDAERANLIAYLKTLK